MKNATRLLKDHCDRRFDWGAKLYPSGEFTLYRKQKHDIKEEVQDSLIALRKSISRGDLNEEVYGVPSPETDSQFWRAAEAVRLRGVSRVAEGPTDATALMGLSAPLISEKRRRGLGGLTTHGKNLVREAAYGLQERFGKWNLTFWTCTLPTMNQEDLINVCRNWGKILENLRAKLKYHLAKAGLPQMIVGVTELQPGRWKKTMYPGWHIHWLFPGKKPSGSWVLDPELGDKLWSEAVEVYCGGTYDFGGSCRLESIRKSAGGYMAKYMSKGSSCVSEVESVFPGCVPSSWYLCTRNLSRWVKSCTRTSDAIARWLYQRLLDDVDSIIAPWAFKLETRPGCHIAVCWLGRIPDPPLPPHPLL